MVAAPIQTPGGAPKDTEGAPKDPEFGAPKTEDDGGAPKDPEGAPSGDQGGPQGGPQGPPPQVETFFGLPTALRPDGRLSATALRPTKIELGALRGPHGSARCTQGLTVAVATVVGPLDSRGAPPTAAGITVTVKTMAQQATGPRMSAAAAAARAAAAAGESLSVQREAAAAAYAAAEKGGGQGPHTLLRRSLDWGRCMEYRLQQLLHSAVDTPQFPRCSIQVVVLLQQDDGSRESCCCNAAFAAAVHAGLPLRWRCWALCYVSPPTMGAPQKGEGPRGAPGGAPREGPPEGPEGTVYLDPTIEEEAAAAAAECLVVDPTTGYLVGAFSCMRLDSPTRGGCYGGPPEALGARGVRGAPQGALRGLAAAAARVLDEQVREEVTKMLQISTAAWGPQSL
ncbi:3' exoribonuclease family, domain 1 containing protein, putative [Eimeria praecox]|uniref:3' exoribonuclease family, domain 1 containing protein, putative n=1 Tax=Eimeria praecox TaxID=51316 RepID=U6G2K9_9EIME|nr:3' exoribonuclease family, domain 1 containing protein, putative [Eimeria praecox]